MTLAYCVDVFRGSKAAKIMNANHDSVTGYGAGKHYQKQDAERLFRELVMRKVIREVCQKNYAGFVNSYIKVLWPFLRISTFQQSI